MSDSNDRFYNQLPAVTAALSDLLERDEAFQTPPADWFVVVTDVRNSTAAYERGQYRGVNIIAASSIIVALNLARARDLEIPFVYGGDGATLLLPPALLPPVMRSLEVLRASSRRRFGLDLRVGALPLTHLREAGETVRVARLRLGSGYDQAVFLDGGLAYAERVIKDTYIMQDHHSARQADLDLAGLECRWSEVAPPRGQPELLCLIVAARDPARHFQIYRQVLILLDEIYGPLDARRPVNQDQLAYSTELGLIAHESYLHFGTTRWRYILRHWWNAWRERLTNRRPAAAGRLELATDHLKIDGTLKTIVAGTPEKREALLVALAKREAAGDLRFGHSVTRTGTITCFIHQASDEYLNFLDGSGGGYAEAARALKAKL